MKRVYRRSELCNLASLPHPRWDLVKEDAYFTTGIVQTTRGCPYNCSFCSIARFFGHKYRRRPVADVIEEIEALDGKYLCFADADIAGNPSRAKELLKALIPCKKLWVADAGINAANDNELLSLAAKSGCKAIYVGFESLSPASLREAGKSQNVVHSYRDLVDKIHQHGIAVGAGFIFGFDNDDKSVFERTVEFAVNSKIDYADFNVLCPYPGTRIYNRLYAEKRIIEWDWSKYFGGCSVVFRPKRMSVDDLRSGCLWAWKQFHSCGSIFRRFLSRPNFTSWFSPLAYLALNIGTRKGISDFARS
jgi:radical SAM superfamily enzyme YgiQ (UPF0313 family)